MNKPLAFFLDVDNTLLDNDHVKKEIKLALINVLGETEALHFWRHHDAFRKYEHLVDFPRIIKQYCSEKHGDRCEIVFLEIFNAIEFAHTVYPHVAQVIKHLKSLGTVSLYTEGDLQYQQMKIKKSGLGTLVDNVFLFEHKLTHLKEVMDTFPDTQRVNIDDRASILLEIKKHYPENFAIEVLQGHYNTIDHREHTELDMKIQHVGELLNFTKDALLPNSSTL